MTKTTPPAFAMLLALNIHLKDACMQAGTSTSQIVCCCCLITYSLYFRWDIILTDNTGQIPDKGLFQILAYCNDSRRQQGRKGGDLGWLCISAAAVKKHPLHPSPARQEVSGLGKNPEFQPQGLSALRPRPPGSSWGVAGAFLGARRPHTTAWRLETSRKCSC